MRQNMIAFHWRELSQHGGHENKLRHKENRQIRNFKEDVSESFLMAEEQSDKCNKCYNNTYFLVIKPQVFQGLLMAPIHLLAPSKDPLLGVVDRTDKDRRQGCHFVTSLSSACAPWGSLSRLRSAKSLLLCWLLSTDLPPCETKSCETKSKIPQGMGSTYQWKQ